MTASEVMGVMSSSSSRVLSNRWSVASMLRVLRTSRLASAVTSSAEGISSMSSSSRPASDIASVAIGARSARSSSHICRRARLLPQLGGDERHVGGQGVESLLQGGGAVDGRRGHASASVSLPAISISWGSGIGLPLSSMFQYTHLNISLPQWFISVSLSSENGPIPGSGYLPGSGSVS